MELNAEQKAAVEMATLVSKTPHSIAVLSGPAGTGKTTTLRAIVEALGEVALMAPTNRAAKRAMMLAGTAASTIHGYLYRVAEDDKGNLTFRRKKTHEMFRPKSNLLIVDESSMVGPLTWQDLWDVVREMDVSILLIGDSFQLPPVVSDPAEEDFSVFSDPFMELCGKQGANVIKRVDLIHVWRQALESPVLRGATTLRENPSDWQRALSVIDSFTQVKNVSKLIKRFRDTGTDNIVISYTNAKRLRTNRDVRSLYGWDDETEPQTGEPLLVRRNNKNVGVSNGEIVEFKGFIQGPVKPPEPFRFTTVNGVLSLISMDSVLEGVSPERGAVQGFKWPYIDVQFGYSVTCHAAQGSEWDSVILNWENALCTTMGKEERIRWLYTAFTRAKHEVLIGGLV